MVVTARARFPLLHGQNPLQRVAARMALSRPRLLEGLLKAGLGLDTLSLLPKQSGLRLKLGLVEKEHGSGAEGFSPVESKPDKQNVSYFTGCLARYLQPSVMGATGSIYHELTGDTLYMPDAQACCGLAAWSSGKQEEARSLARKNIAAFAETSGPILTSCASCSSHLFSYPDLFVDDPEWYEKAHAFTQRVQEFSTFILDISEEGRFVSQSSIKLYYHEPCHLRFDPENRGATHRLLDRIQHISRVDTEDESRCCGQGGLFHLGYPELSEKIFENLYGSAPVGDSGVVVTTCSGCLMQWQAGLAHRRSSVDAVHLSVFLAGCIDINA
jgi:glycolate oxidase iron-sulfur subunit